VSGRRLTVRARLTLLYTGLFALCGAAIVVITFILVPRTVESDPSAIQVENPQEFLVRCREALHTTDDELRAKCDRAFQEGVVLGAQGQREATVNHLLQYSVITLVAVTLVAALAGWIVAGRPLRRVQRITAAARTASQHNLSARVALTGPRDELRELADTFDDMLGRLDTTFTSQRQFIANAGHELRTPLTVMRTAVDVVLARPEPTRAELIEMGHAVHASVGHAEKLLAALLTLARNEHGLTVREPVDLATIAEDALDGLDRGDRTERRSLQPAVVCGDPVLLERLVVNLLDNAVRYNEPGGQVWVSTATAGGRPALTVANTGPRVPAETVDQLFEPFRRLHERTSRDGFGLGLTIVASIAAVHGATVTASPGAAGGLTVTIPFPPAENFGDLAAEVPGAVSGRFDSTG
jgi:signal transduction histidine kinase